jgi:dephospho-CoA kinase
MSARDEQSQFVVGLTGGVGSGKSSAAKAFAALGAYVIDVDDISHSLTGNNGAALQKISQTFPGTVVEGALDRIKLRELVFADSVQRQKLEAILHPMIRKETFRRLGGDEASRAPYVLLVVPLLFESSSYTSMIDCAVVVDIDEVDQIARVASSRGVPEATVAKIIAAQMSRQDRLSHAQFVIDNRGDKENLLFLVERLHTVFVANAQSNIARHAVAQATEFTA